MSKVSTQELDLQIQLSLVAKIRQAANTYKTAPGEAGSAALQSYIAALECLAEHIATRCRGSQVALETSQRLNGEQPRVIRFPGPSGSGAPLTAA
jgi:hypothetical protein